MLIDGVIRSMKRLLRCNRQNRCSGTVAICVKNYKSRIHLDVVFQNKQENLALRQYTSLHKQNEVSDITLY